MQDHTHPQQDSHSSLGGATLPAGSRCREASSKNSTLYSLKSWLELCAPLGHHVSEVGV